MSDSSNRVVVLVQAHWFGHCETQIQLLAGMIMRWGWRVLILCPEPRAVDQWVHANLPQAADRCHSFYFTTPRWRRAVQWFFLRDSIRESEEVSGWKADMVLLLGLDNILNSPFLWLPALVGKPWTGLYMCPSRHCRSGVPVPIWLKVLLLFRDRLAFRSPLCRGVAIEDEGAGPILAKILGEVPLYSLPVATDEALPVEQPEWIRDMKKKAGDRIVIGLVGLVEKRKGVLSLLRAGLNSDPERTFFLIAGKLCRKGFSWQECAELDRLLAQAQAKNFFLRLEYIASPADVNAAIAACDIVHLVYERHFNCSAILTKTARFNKLVIASRGYCIGERVENFGLGVTISEGDPVALAEVIFRLSDPAERRSLQAAADFTGYHALHTVAALEQTIGCLLRKQGDGGGEERA